MSSSASTQIIYDIRWAPFVHIPLLLLLYVAYQTASKRSGNYPDGPKSSFLVGNMLDVNVPYLPDLLTEWSRRYGDFYAYTMASTPVIVISSLDSMNDLIVKRGQKYSCRPKTSPQAALITQNSRIISTQYGARFRMHRKAMHDLIGINTSKIFMPFQEYESRRTLLNMLDQPTAFWEEFSRFSGSVTFSMLLGCRFERSDAFIPQQIEHRLQEFFSHISPGAWLVDWIPILDYLPDFLAPWRKHAVAVRENIMSFYGVFYDSMKEKVRAGTAPDCFVSRLIKEQSGTMSENEHVHFMADLLQAGTETTATTMKWFYKACVLHPEAVLRAQAELDRVVGNSRLPTWDDRKSLPYLHAFIEELHRWATVAPLAFPHATSEADTYRGKKIPAGTTVMINLHAIHRNPEYYPEPESFIPERFFEESRLAGGPGAKGLPAAYAFGVGRRECPGKHVADANLYIMISRILWAFDVEAGSAPPPSGFSGVFPIFGPAKFDCVMRPRSAEKGRLIRGWAVINRPREMEDSSVYDSKMAAYM